MTPLEFATQKLSEGVEILCRNNRLRFWPGRAFRHFAPEDRAFINDHKEELKAIAVARTLPETQITWTPPSERKETHEATAHESAPPSEPACPYCCQSPCISSQHPAYATLHFNDPSEVDARSRSATAVMRGSINHWGRR